MKLKIDNYRNCH